MAESAAEGLSFRVLPNGLTVAVQEDDRFPLASVRLYVHNGSAFETPEEAGISHLLEHMVFRSTAKRASGQIAKTVESAGGEINAATSFDNTVYYVNMPAESVSLGLDIIHDMIFGAKFLPEELEQEKKVVLSELDRGKDNPGHVLFEDLQAEAWPDKPYGRPIIGFRDTVSKVTSEDLHAFVKRRYQPQEMLLVVCGDVKTDVIMKEAETLFGNLANDRAIQPVIPYVPSSVSGGPRVSVAYGEWSKVYLHVAFEIPGIGDAREAPLELLAQLLGGDETSRLYRTFKYEKRLVDDISAGAVTLERSGLFLIDAELDPKNIDAFWAALMAELANLKADSFTKEEIDRAKLNLEDSLYRAKETISGVASKLGYFMFYGYGPKGEENYLTELSAAGKDQLQDAISRYLKVDALRGAVLLPKADEGKITGKTLVQAATSIWPAVKSGAAGKESAASQDKKADVVDLGQGRKLVLLPDKTLPYISASLVFNGGDALLKKNQQGLAALAADAMLTGVKGKNANAIEDFLADRAASLSASSGRDSFTVGAKFPSRFAKDIFGLMREALFEPTFDKTEFGRVLESQLAAIKAQQDQPMALAFRRLFPFVYAGGYYSYMRLGEPDVIKGFTPEDAKAFWQAQRNMPWVMAVCGDFDRDMVVNVAKELAASMQAKESFTFASGDWSQKREEILKLAERNQTHILMVFPIEGEVSQDAAGLELLNSILAGQGGLLFRDLRDKQGLGYSVTSFLWQTVNTGLMAFYIGTEPAKAEQALEGFRKTAAMLHDQSLSEEDVARGKKLLMGDYYRERQSLNARSGEAAQDLAAGFPLNHKLSVIEKSKNLGPEDLRKLAQKYLNPDKAYILKIEP